MKNYVANSAEIASILTDVYFKGIYEGDVNLPGSTFYFRTLLFGDAAGKPYFKTLAEYQDGVGTGKVRGIPGNRSKEKLSPWRSSTLSLWLWFT